MHPSFPLTQDMSEIPKGGRTSVSEGAARWRTICRNLFGTLAISAVCFAIGCSKAHAFDVISVPTDVDALDISESVDVRPNHGQLFQVSTAPGSDGVVRRIEVDAENGTNDDWAVFALTNPTEEQIQRLLVVPHFRLVNSGILNPDLDMERISAISASQGVSPERVYSPEADIFLITLEPGAVITFVAELTTPKLPRVILWKPGSYSDNASLFTLYQGMILGIAGLLAVFLTIIFVIRGSMLFPAAAALAWTVLIFCGVDFGIWSKVLGLALEGKPYYRAVSEFLLAGCFLMFNITYLNQGHRRLKTKHVMFSSIGFLVVLLVIAIASPSFAAGIARVSLAAVGIAGTVAILVFALRRHDRSILLLPTWLLLLFWLFGAMMAVTGRLDNELIQPALSGGLVMIVLLIGFSVMKHAFTGGEVIHGVDPDSDRRALALIGSGDIVWEWDVENDRISSDSKLEDLLNMSPDTLSGSSREWLEFVHPEDRNQFLAMLVAIEKQQKGRIVKTIRFRENGGNYRTFLLKARPVLGQDASIVQCIGTMQDITELEINESRLMNDANFDDLTGLPSRNLFLDRLQNALVRSVSEGLSFPAVFVFNLDGYDDFVQKNGVQVTDTILLTVFRRLNRILKPQDCLARLSSEKFAVMLLSANSSTQAEEFAEILMKSLRSPITYGEVRAEFTCCVGIMVADNSSTSAGELMNYAEVALEFAKNTGKDTLTVYNQSMLGGRTPNRLTEKDLRRAVGNGELKVFYQPVMNIETGFVAGFEAGMRWQHPTRGIISTSELETLIEQHGLVHETTKQCLEETSKQLKQWQSKITEGEPLFLTVFTPSRKSFSHELISAIKSLPVHKSLSANSFKLGVNESMIVQNPVFYIRMLERLKAMGTGLVLSDFGRGYSVLNYLHSIPFDMLKIEMNFMHSSRNRGRLVLLRNIVNLAKELGMEVVAVGGDSKSDESDLFQINCKLAQGNAYGPYASVAEAEELVTKRYISSNNWQQPAGLPVSEAVAPAR